MKKIQSACIRYKKPGNETFDYASDYCHSACYDYVYNAFGIPVRLDPNQYSVTEGFMCDDGTFVDRIDAMDIAKAANQVKKMYNSDDYIALQSYMLE